MDKRAFRFNDPCQPCEEGIGCDECDHLPKKEESEKSVPKAEEAIYKTDKEFMEDNPSTDSKESFWNSYPLEDMSPEQRKHFRKVMRIEVRK